MPLKLPYFQLCEPLQNYFARARAQGLAPRRLAPAGQGAATCIYNNNIICMYIFSFHHVTLHVLYLWYNIQEPVHFHIHLYNNPFISTLYNTFMIHSC